MNMCKILPDVVWGGCYNDHVPALDNNQTHQAYLIQEATEQVATRPATQPGSGPQKTGSSRCLAETEPTTPELSAPRTASAPGTRQTRHPSDQRILGLVPHDRTNHVLGTKTMCTTVSMNRHSKYYSKPGHNHHEYGGWIVQESDE